MAAASVIGCPGVSQGSDMPRESVTFATFNLLNLTARGQGAYAEPPLADRLHDERIGWIAGMLRRLKADVVAVQELWDREPLEEALEEAGLKDTHRVLFPTPAEGGRRTIWCAAVVRSEMVDDASVRWVTDFPPGFRLRTEGIRPLSGPGEPLLCPPADAKPAEPAYEVTLARYSRPVLRFTLRLGEDRDDVEVFVCHLKSKLGTPIACDAWFQADEDRLRPHKDAIGAALSTIRRTAEAAALRAEINGVTRGRASAASPKRPVVLLGDVNDGQDTSTMAILTGDPPIGDPTKKLIEDGAALFSVQGIQEARSLRDVFYTYVRKGVHSSLDNILVSEEFYDWSARRDWVMEDLHIHNDHLNKTWGGKTVIESDHGIVRARFVWKPMAAA